jgi:DNA-binding MarR family transcriptional regulator
MTIREFYQAVIDLADTDSATDPSMTFGGFPVPDISNKASELLAALDARNEKRKGTETKEKKETAERRAAVLAFLKEQTEPVTRDTIAGVLDMEPAKVSGACKGLVDAGLVTKSEIKVEKARKVAYSAVK